MLDGTLQDVQEDSAVRAHCERCESCAGLAAAIRVMSRWLADTLNRIEPRDDPRVVAEVARRVRSHGRPRWVERIILVLFAAVLALSGSAMLIRQVRIVRSAVAPILREPVRIEVLPLRCLSQAQAKKLLQENLRTADSVFGGIPADARGLAVRATDLERAEIDVFLRRVDVGC